MATSLVDNTPPALRTFPTLELGTATTGIVPWSVFYDTAEDVAVPWPNSVFVYNKMRKDDQIAALLLAFMLPIMGYLWYLDSNGVRDEVVEHCANDFGVPIESQDSRRWAGGATASALATTCTTPCSSCPTASARSTRSTATTRPTAGCASTSGSPSSFSRSFCRFVELYSQAPVAAQQPAEAAECRACCRTVAYGGAVPLV
jgi:hypothetical protein